MKPIHSLAILAVLLAVPNRSHALEDIELVTKERAKALGLQLRAVTAGPDLVRVELEFETQGELKGYRYVVLQVQDGGKTLATSLLKEEKSKQGTVRVAFTADRAKLGQFTLKVVEQTRPTRAGHLIQVKDFVDLDKLR